jgi:hypothetical protein
MTTLSEPVAGPYSSSSAIHASSDANNDLPKRKRARTRKRKSGAAAGATDQGDEDEDGQEAFYVGGQTAAASNDASPDAATSKGKGKTTVSVPADQPVAPVKVADAPATSAPVTTEGAVSKEADDGGSDDDNEGGEENATGRKRKRSRKRSKKGGQAETAAAVGNDSNGATVAQDAGPAALPSVATTLPGAELVKQLAQTPNPERDESISQGAKNGESPRPNC